MNCFFLNYVKQPKKLFVNLFKVLTLQGNPETIFDTENQCHHGRELVEFANRDSLLLLAILIKIAKTRLILLVYYAHSLYSETTNVNACRTFLAGTCVNQRCQRFFP